LERRLPELGEDAAIEAIARAIPNARLHPLCARVTEVAPLYALFQAAPPLSSHTAREVRTLAAIADLRPHPELMLAAGDGPFMRMLRHLAQPGGSPERIFFEDLVKLVALRSLYPGLTDRLAELAEEEGWAAGAQALESALQTGRGEQLGGGWEAVFSTVRDLDAETSVDSGAAALLLQTPRLSEMLREEARAFFRVELPDIAALPLSHVYTEETPASDAEKARLLAQHAFDEAKKTPFFHDILEQLELRQWAARHCVSLRGFAKLNGLERQWPVLARMLRADRATLRALEGEALRPGSLPPELQELWKRHAGDERLRRFLTLAPLVTDIAPEEVRNYFAVSQAISPAGGPDGPRPGDLYAPSPDERQRPNYVDLVVTFTPLPPDGGEPAGGDGETARPDRFRVTLEEPGAPALHEVTEVPWPEFGARDAPAPAAQALVTRQQPRRRMPMNPDALHEMGALMWRWAFPGKVGERILEFHERGTACRLLLGIPSLLAGLPWEALYLEQGRVAFGLTQRYSIVRHLGSRPLGAGVGISVPLRILVVLSNPHDLPPLNLEGEFAALEEALGPALHDGRVSLHVLRGSKANLEELQKVVRTVRPQIFHFTGHGVFDRGLREGALMLHDAADRARAVGATDVATLLR
ncbi:MAG TPA: CHAT domain-containing protein, partial [Longimicrobium sp.]|nr:CHAT domain-containing protein [Longimicrobium sp.]